MKQIDELFCLSLSVGEGDSAEVRERATLKESEVSPLFKGFCDSDVDTGLLYLGTCHRVEVYGFGIPTETVAKVWLHDRNLGDSQAHLFRGADVMRHLIRVTSSLDSEVLGETQITGQVREAAEISRKLGLLKGSLDRCVQQALRVAKKVRSQTHLGEGTVSVAHVAVDGLTDVFDRFDNKRALVVGAGRMATQALERLLEIGVAEITWINRSRPRIDSHLYGSRVKTADFTDLARLTWQHPIIVAATASSLPLLNRASLSAVRQREVAGPRVILDLGLPRNIHQDVHNYRGFLLRNVDEFRDRAERNTSLRRQAIEAAEAIVAGELEVFLKVWNTWGRGPWIAELYKGIEQLREQELQDTTAVNSELADVKEIEYITRSIYAKLMHRLVEELDSVEEPLGNQVLEILVRSWRHPEKWLQRSQQSLLKSQSKASKAK